MQDRTYRILDANFNRAREALRVMEEFARFWLNHAALTEHCKLLRHRLCQTFSQLPPSSLLISRDTPGDVGTAITTESESRRTGELSVVTAAAKRLTEALRCLEEYGKILHAAFAREIESIRYEAYELEKQLLLGANRPSRFPQVRLYVLLTESLCKLPLLETARQALAAGADCIQLREKTKSDRDILDLSKILAPMCRNAGALFLLNDRCDLASLAGADGVHLGRDDLSVPHARILLPPEMIVGKTSHNIEEARSALMEGADYIAVGSIFGSETKPQVETKGLALIENVKTICDRPIVAIGGINAENASLAIRAGASAVAVCQGIIAAENPAEATRRIKQSLSDS